MSTFLPLGEVKAKFSEMVGRAKDHHEEIIITVHGQPAAVLLSYEQFDSMQETLDILSDKDVARELLFGEERQGEDYTAPPGATPAEILADLRTRHEADSPPPEDTTTYSEDEVKQALRERDEREADLKPPIKKTRVTAGRFTRVVAGEVQTPRQRGRGRRSADDDAPA